MKTPEWNHVIERCFVLVGFTLWLSASVSCSIKKMAVNQIGNALAGGGSVYASDDDPELIKAAAPFSLKLMESLLAESPRHKNLLFAASSGFAQYAYAFVQQEADELEDTDFARAQQMRSRARRLYLRARNYGLRGLEAKYRGFEQALRQNPRQSAQRVQSPDVPLVYWTAVSWAAAISVSKDHPDLLAEIPLMEALIDRALALDEDFESGAIHSFLITYEMARQSGEGDPEVRARRHFDRAMEISRGQLASPLVALAEAVSIQKQDLKEFEMLLERALAIDPDADPENRLLNLVMQRRARWLLSKKGDLFLISQEK